MEQIKQILKKLRKDHGLTQDELAQKLFVSRQTISNWENGKSYPDISHLHRMSDIYGESLLDIFPAYSSISQSDTKVSRLDGTEAMTEAIAYNRNLFFYACFLNFLAIFTPLLPPLAVFIQMQWRQELPARFFKGSMIFLVCLSAINLIFLAIAWAYLFFTPNMY